MGRYLVGTAGFSYKYVFGEQPANLSSLARESGAGDGGMVPVLSALLDPEGFERFPVFELLRDHVRRTGDAEAVRAGLQRGDLRPAGSGESLCYLVGELAIPLVTALDSRLSVAVKKVVLAACGAYALDRADYPALLAWIRGSAPDVDLDLGAVGDGTRVQAAAERLGGKRRYLPYMALWILHHAVAHDLDRIEVCEQAPEIGIGPEGSLDELWEVIRYEWGPPELSSPDLPADPDALLARGLICSWSGGRDAALAALRVAHERGDPRAARWLGALGEPVDPLPAPPPGPDHPDALERALARLDLEER